MGEWKEWNTFWEGEGEGVEEGVRLEGTLDWEVEGWLAIWARRAGGIYLFPGLEEAGAAGSRMTAPYLDIA